MRIRVIFVAAMAVSCSALHAQAGAPAPAAAIVPPPAATPASVAVLTPPSSANVLRSGTEVPLITREDLTTKKKQLRIGQRVQLEVASNVEMNGVVVIPAGTPAIAELTEVRNKGMWGKSGYIAARILSLRLGDRQIRLSGSFDDKGVTGTAGVVGAVALLPVAGFFTTGTSATIPTGSAVKGFLDEDVPFQVVASTAPVLSVPAAPQPGPMAATPNPVTPKQ